MELFHHRIQSSPLAFITFDSRLSFEAHVESLERRLSKIIYLLRSLSIRLDRETLLMCYHALFHSVMSYGILVWGGSSFTGRILLLQKRAIRAVVGVNQRVSCRPLFADLGILTCTNQFIYECIIYSRKNFNTHEGLYNTRNNFILLPRFKLERTRSTFRFISIKLFNALPGDWKAMTVGELGMKLKSFLKSNCFYTIDEFTNFWKANP